MSLRIAAILLLLLTTPAGAGVVYRYTTKITGDPVATGSSATVWLDGPGYRIVLDPDPSGPRAWDIAVSNGAETFLINSENQTWYRPKPLPTVRFFGGRETRLRGKVKASHQVEGTETIDGRSVTKHAMRIDFRQTEDFGSTRVGSTISITFLVWAAPGLTSIPLQRDLTTGIAQVDEALARLFASIEGLPLRKTLSVTRRYDGGGVPTTILVTTTVTDIEETTIPPSRFEVPKTYREQEPVIAVPGRSRPAQ